MRIRSSVLVYDVVFAICILRQNLGECNPITNSNFNEHIREFSSKDDNVSIIEY